MSETTSKIVAARFRATPISVWEQHRALITKLYVIDNNTLKDVMAILESEHGFFASARQYKLRMKAWNLNKYCKSSDILTLLRRDSGDKLQTAVQGGSVPPVFQQGKAPSQAKVMRHLRRRGHSLSLAEPTESPLTGSLPTDFVVASPSTLSDSQIIERTQSETGATFNSQSLTSFDPGLDPLLTTASDACSRSQKSNSLDVASHSPSRVSPAPADRFTNEGDGDDDDESASRRKRTKVSGTNFMSALETKALACPFYKHNPRRYSPQNMHIDSAMRYRTCAGPGWESISRLRQHLFRAHVDLKQCRVCKSVVQTRGDLENHARTCPQSVTTDLSPASETISDGKQYRLKQKMPPGLTREQSWRRVYQVLFPQESRHPSPYYRSNDTTMTDAASTSAPLDHVESLIEHLSNTLPQKISTAWQENTKFRRIPVSTKASLSIAGESDGESRQSSRAQIEGSIESNMADRLDHPLSPTSTENLQTLVSETIAKSFTEWLSNRKEPDGDSDAESDAESEQSHISNTSTHGHVLQDSTSMARMPEQRGEDSERPSHLSGGLHSTNYSSWTTSSLMLDSTPLLSTSWVNPPDPTRPFYGLPNLMLDDSFDAAAANAYDFSYLPMSPGISFLDLDPSLQADIDMASHTALSGNSPNAGMGGAFGNAFPPDPLAPVDWAPWTDTDVSPDLDSATLLPDVNPET